MGPEDEEYQDSDVLDDDDAPWRGDVHLSDWPENLAGPEYWSGNGETDLREQYPPKDEED